MLDSRNHQGKFGQDYVRVLASAAGLLVYEYDLDMDGIDLGFRLPGPCGPKVSPAIEAQIKSWSRGHSVRGEWHFDGLNEVQFNKLAGPDFTVPRFLFLICVPRDPARYATINGDGMMLRQLGYYRSLANEDRIARPDKNRRKPVSISTGDVLTTRSLLELVSPGRIGLGRTG